MIYLTSFERCGAVVFLQPISTTMFRLILAITSVSLVLSAVPSRLPSPDKLALVLGEEEFEDYLDKWLAITERTWVNASVNIASRVSRSGNF